LTGLPEGIAVAVGNVDAHVTAPAARAIAPGEMVAVMGTSTCHVVNATNLVSVPGMCGVVDGGVLPGLYGYEAGQSGVGDIFGWYVDNGLPAAYRDAATALGLSAHGYLSRLAAGQRPGEHGLLALDWHSGNRSILVDHELSGVIIGLTLATKPEDVYRALVEATAFGTRTIVDAFERNGVPVTKFIAAGGLVANPFVMQVYADVLARPISVIGTDQGPALGSAIHAAVAAGAYEDVREAAATMGKVVDGAYSPHRAATRVYDELFAEYTELHDYFGRGGTDVLHRLRDIRRSAVGS
jgi:L-ribulokinase